MGLRGSVTTLRRHRRLLLIITDMGDGLSSQAFPFTMGGHTTEVITGLALTPTITVGVAGKKQEQRANRLFPDPPIAYRGRTLRAEKRVRQLPRP